MLTPKPTRQELVGLLTRHEVIVKFTKVDGTLREMLCTLMPSMLPPAKPKLDETRVKKENNSVVCVYCTDKQEWRSFRVDSVISIEIRKSIL